MKSARSSTKRTTQRQSAIHTPCRKWCELGKNLWVRVSLCQIGVVRRSGVSRLDRGATAPVCVVPVHIHIPT